MKDYQLQKRELLGKWLAGVNDKQICIFTAQALVEQWTFSRTLRDFLAQFASEECIYLLSAKLTSELIPLYIGKSTDVLRRWEAHLHAFFLQKKGYARWWEMLVTDNTFSYDTYLTVVPQSKILVAPIPDFPVAVGSVEYQLVSLASDAYPEYLLNREGNRR